MEIKYAVETRGNVLIFTILQNEINKNQVASLKEKLFLEIADRNSKIVLNLKHVQTIDSSGLGAILFGTRQARNAGGNLVLATVNPKVETMIRIAQLDRVFDIFTSIEEAVSFFE